MRISIEEGLKDRPAIYVPHGQIGVFRRSCVDRRSEFLGTESGMGVGQRLEQWGNRLRGDWESREICGLETRRAYVIGVRKLWRRNPAWGLDSTWSVGESVRRSFGKSRGMQPGDSESVL